MIGSFILTAILSTSAMAGEYDFLDAHSLTEQNQVLEESLRDPNLPLPPSLDIDLSSYLDAFRKDQTLTIYIGWGADTYSIFRPKELYNMLRELVNQAGLSTSDWKFEWNWKTNTASTLSFRENLGGVRFEIVMGHELKEWSNALSKYEIVIYTGHSRSGRGPAFDSLTNYFRMGNLYSALEVDTRNPYFQNEPILFTETYPLQQLTEGGTTYFYQYRGQKISDSDLKSEAYTKNIPGGDLDLQRASFLKGKQILWLHSCSNWSYFRIPLRTKFPDVSEKFIFGSNLGTFGYTKTDAVFIFSWIKGITQSRTIVDELNRVEGCGKECFTTY